MFFLCWQFLWRFSWYRKILPSSRWRDCASQKASGISKFNDSLALTSWYRSPTLSFKSLLESQKYPRLLLTVLENPQRLRNESATVKVPKLRLSLVSGPANIFQWNLLLLVLLKISQKFNFLGSQNSGKISKLSTYHIKSIWAKENLYISSQWRWLTASNYILGYTHRLCCYEDKKKPNLFYGSTDASVELYNKKLRYLSWLIMKIINPAILCKTTFRRNRYCTNLSK